MEGQSILLRVSDTIGAVSGEYTMPAHPNAMMTLAHGAGTGMNHSFMINLSHALAEAGIATLRFNFPFFQNKVGRPDTPAVAHQTIAAAIAEAQKSFPALPLFASGKSFGGRMTSQLLAKNPDPAVKGIVFYGFPLHPAGKPATDRADHLKDIKVPMLFLQGTRDELASIELLEPVCTSLPQATLVKIEGADHAFKAGKINVIDLLTTATADWVRKRLAR